MERAVYRIIDANFNRAREALRVMEDFCRFYLNSPALSGRTKELRHRLSAAIGELDRASLLAGRDTPGDVGTNISVQGQLSRKDLADCLAAAASRLTEALRTVSEAVQTFNPALADNMEKLRYQAYTLEKDVSLACDVRGRFAGVRLYVLVSSSDPAEVAGLTQKCCRGGADCIQLRAKGMADALLLETAQRFVGICREAGVFSVINDRVDVAVAAGADGVHLGQEDLPVSAARKLQAGPLAVGVSTHTPSQLHAAIDAGADYVGVGPVFATETKPAVETAGLEYLRQAAPVAAAAGVPAVAIGGINLENVTKVLANGALCVAVCGAICNASDPQKACADFANVVNTGRGPAKTE